MSLNIYQKSVYITLFNSTMIGRSVGKTLKVKNKSFKDFKLAVLKESNSLINKMEKNNLFEKDIIIILDKLVEVFEVSYGQAQKGINVILKYHYQLYKEFKNYNGNILHCPLDSNILTELGIKNLPLSRINKEMYLSIQKKISGLSNKRVNFDKKYENKYFKRFNGII
jgi:hypothetical protein